MFEASSGDRDFSPGLCPTSRLISTHSANFLEARFGPTSDRNQFVMTIDVMGSPNWFFSQSRKRNRADPADACSTVRTALLYVPRAELPLSLVWPIGQHRALNGSDGWTHNLGARELETRGGLETVGPVYAAG